MTIAAYITAYKNPQVAECIKAIQSQTVPVDEILTVEDGHAAGDDSLAVAESLGVRIIHDHGRHNMGLPASCNTALTHAKGTHFLKVDGDVALGRHWIERALPHLQGDIVAVGGRLVELHSCSIPGQWRAAFLRQWLPHWTTARTGPDLLFGCATLFRTDALRAVGGWNEKHRYNYQDASLSHKLGRHRLVYEPACLAQHLLRGTLGQVLENYWRCTKDPEDCGYGSVAEAAGRIEYNFLRSQSMLESCVDGAPTLAYPSFLYRYWACLEDLAWVKRLHPDMADEADKTKNDLYVVFKEQRDVIANRLYRDLMAWRSPEWPGGPNEPYLSAFRKSITEVDAVSQWCIETSIRVMEEGDRELAVWKSRIDDAIR